ncbi:MAG: T9SS type A sorting domain-containing protein, partial [Marinirhabdus sp.]|nr:T9SS type A sorting domain-containing protein [Marinirhabdus sp.]
TSPPAFDIYSEWASSYLAENDYPYGVTFQMLGYTSCGTTRDYMHSEEVYGWTPEIAGDGFWPPESTIFDLVAENVRPFLFQTYIAGAYLDVQEHEIIGDVIPGEDFELAVTIKNIGVGAAANAVSVIVTTNSPDVISPTAGGFGTIEARDIKDNNASPFVFSVLPEIESGSFIITVTTVHDGVFNEQLEIPVVLGEREVLFFDDAENSASNWTATGNGNILWGINTDDSYSGTQSFGDSEDGNGANNTETFFELNPSFDLTATAAPRLSYVYKHSLPSPDIVQLQVSTDNGASWNALREYTDNEAWTNESINLEAFKDFTEVKFRFRLSNNFNIPGDGFYFDDFTVADYLSDLLTVEDEALQTITLSPNPFTNQLEVHISNSLSDLTLRLYDQLGRELHINAKRLGNVIRVQNLEGLQSGIYFLSIMEETTHSVVVKRIIKK